MRRKPFAAIAFSLLAACAGLAACASAGAGGGELVVVESHQFT
jgi:hypothetical protein